MKKLIFLGMFILLVCISILAEDDIEPAINRNISDTEGYKIIETLSFNRFSAQINRRQHFVGDFFSVVNVVYDDEGERHENIIGDARYSRRVSSNIGIFNHSCILRLAPGMEIEKIKKYFVVGVRPEVFVTYEKWYGGYIGTAGHFSFIPTSINIPFPNLKYEYTHGNDGRMKSHLAGFNQKIALNSHFINLDALAGYEKWEDSFFNRSDNTGYKLSQYLFCYKVGVDYEWMINNSLQLNMGFFVRLREYYKGAGVNIIGLNISF